jgi:hypothetical protein
MPFKALFLLVSVTAVITAGFGCTRTVVGGSNDSPDKKWRVYARVYGAYGRAFLDETPKTVRISIVTADTKETLLFRKEYRVTGSGVTWDAAWDERGNPTIVLYDHGRGVYWEDGEKNGTPTNHLRTIVYHFHPETRQFSEQPVK